MKALSRFSARAPLLAILIFIMLAGQDRDGGDRQKADDRPPDDESAVERSPDARIGALRAVVSHHEIFGAPEADLERIVRRMDRLDVRLVEHETGRVLLARYGHAPVLDVDRLARPAAYAPDVINPRG